MDLLLEDSGLIDAAEQTGRGIDSERPACLLGEAGPVRLRKKTGLDHVHLVVGLGTLCAGA